MKIELMKLSSIKPYPNNPRINDAAIDAVMKSLRDFGIRQSIVVDKDHVIVVGHARYKAALQLKLDRFPVHVADNLTDAQIRAYRIADNKTAEFAEWDTDRLIVELSELRSENFDMDSLGFDDAELDELLGDATDIAIEDVAPELPEVAVSEPGKIYQLGRHRLMCGDSLNPENIKLLTAEKWADMVFTDPPYNMNYQSKNLGGIKNDKMSEAKFVSFILASLMAMKKSMSPTASYYICMSAAEYPTVYHQLRKCGMSGRQIIWVKPAAGLGGQEYRPQYEVMLFGYLGSRSERVWNGERRQSDIWDFLPERPLVAREEHGDTVIELGDGVETTQIHLDGKVSGAVAFFDGSTSDLWRFARPNGTYVHPTQKPVALVERAIENSSRPDDLVLDIFGGSGSTLIACENTGRRACLMELDPKYCDVIRRRYAEFTHGNEADWQSLTPGTDRS